MSFVNPDQVLSRSEAPLCRLLSVGDDFLQHRDHLFVPAAIQSCSQIFHLWIYRARRGTESPLFAYKAGIQKGWLCGPAQNILPNMQKMRVSSDKGVFEIETFGLTIEEANQLAEAIKGIAEVGTVDVHADKLEAREAQRVRARGVPIPLTINAAAGYPHLLIHVARYALETAAAGIAKEALTRLYAKVGEAIVEKGWTALKDKFSGKEKEEGGFRLYGPDGTVIREVKGKR